MAMVSNVEPLDFWRLCDELSVVQAALLIVEVDPSKCMSYVEDWELEKRPAGYAAAKAAICGALQCKNVTGTIIPFYNDRFDGEYKIEGSLDPGEKSAASWIFEDMAGQTRHQDGLLLSRRKRVLQTTWIGHVQAAGQFAKL